MHEREFSGRHNKTDSSIDFHLFMCYTEYGYRGKNVEEPPA